MKLFSKKNAASLTAEEIASAVRAAQAEDRMAEAAGEPRTGARVPLTHRTVAKVTAFILFIVMLLTAAASAGAAVFMLNEELYTTSEWSYRRDALNNIADGDVLTLIHYLSSGTEEADGDAMRFLGDRNIASVELSFSEGSRNKWTYDGGVADGPMEFTGVWYHMKHEDSAENWYSWHNEYGKDAQQIGTVEATIRLSDTFTQQDHYYFADLLISAAYAMRYWVYAIGAAAVILMIVCFVFLMCASGRRKGYAEPQPGWGTKIPLDLLTAGTAMAAFLLVQLTVEAAWFHAVWKQVAVCGTVVLALTAILLGWCMSFALRVKLGVWWKNTLIVYALRLALRVLRAFGRGLRVLAVGVRGLLRAIPLVWKAVLAYAVLAAVNGFLIVATLWQGALFFWMLQMLLLFPAVVYLALMLRRLQLGGKALAEGDLSYQVDTRYMVWDLKRHGEALNRIGEGMTAAVEQRMKSERMKTELITNVSHDIKTPLTSIINYSDLIGKEPCGNEKITEYAGVLHRQSERLKRLIEDLVEASKASTGNLEMLLAPCEVGVMLAQTAGEYEQRLEECRLQLVTKQPEKPVRILADGRRLWRVFDNLMSNVCKYAQAGTRVYLTLEETNGKAVISFKNTSREPLNLTPDELLERFVQGDMARRSDGNGLGLSIAKSLVELQNGTMELTVDGDLFKVVLTFSLLR